MPQRLQGGRVPSLLFPVSVLPGQYYSGGSLSYRLLELKPNQSFRFEEDSDVGEPNRSQGDWRLEGDRLLLFPTRSVPPDRGRGAGYRMQTRFVPVKWEQRLYLVDEHQMPAFCDMASSRVNALVSLRNRTDLTSAFLKYPTDSQSGLRSTYPPLTTDSHPVLPVRYRTFYERGPVRCRVVRMLTRLLLPEDHPAESLVGKPITGVLLDRGTQARVKPGLLLAIRSTLFRTNLVVITARPQEAEALRVDFMGDKPEPVMVGDEFTSGEWMEWPYDTSVEFPKWALAMRDAWNRS